MAICSKCGKELKESEENYRYENKVEICICNNCLEIFEKGSDDFEKWEKQEIERRKEEEKIIKQDIKKSDLSINELQLKEIKGFREDIKKIGNDMNTIKNILMFFLIIFLIGLISYIVLMTIP